MVDGKKLIRISLILIGIFFYNCLSIAMEKPYHHLPDGTFRNPEGSPKRDPNVKWSYKIFNQEKKKLDMTVPKEHVVEKEKVLSDLKKYQDDDYVAWIGHATFLIKLGETTIITDPVFSKNAGPLIFGPDRFTEPALKLNEIPKIDLFLLTHNHYDHQDMSTIRKFPYKNAKVLLPLKLSKYFKRYKDVVAKPINGFSGNNVILLKSFNASKIKRLIKTHNHVFFQKFLPGVSKGDKRVFIIKGKIVGAISRVPKKGSILSNMSKGAQAKLTKLTKKEVKVSKVIGKLLVKNKIYFAGIDFIQEKLIGDINVTSPTGLAAYKDLSGINLAKVFWNNI